MANQNFKVKKGLEVGTGTTVSIDGINVTGVITATSFSGDGSGITGVTAEGTGVSVRDEGSLVGTAATINFIGASVTTALSGAIANVTISAGGLSNVVEDTTPQLGGNLDLNSKDITGTGNISITGGFNATGVSTFQENVVFQTAASFGDSDKINVGAGNDLQIFHDGTSNIISDAVGAGISLVGNTKVVGVLTATSFSGSLATTDLTGTITNAQLAGSISNDKLAGSIADNKLASTFLKNVVEDTTPQLGGNLDVNSKDITGTGNINLTGVVTATSFSGSGIGLTGASAATVDIAVDSSNASQYVTFVASGVGNRQLLLDGGLRYNPSTNQLTAGSFSGSGANLTALTGASAGTYGASTNTPIITVDSNGRITGISTVATAGAGGGGGISNIVEDTTPQLGGNLDLNSKTINGTGNIDITGYAAVSGVSTFSGIAGFTTHITLPDYAEIQIGGATGGDLKIYHDASHSYVSDEGTGNLKFRSNAFKFTNVAENKTSMVVTPPGAVELYHDNALRLATTNTGVSITDNLNVAGVSTFQSHIHLGDDDELRFGAGNDFKIYHDPNDCRFENTNGDIKFKNSGSYFFFDEDGGETLASFINDGAVNLYYNGSKKFETTNTGATVTGTLAATAVTGDGSGLTGLPAAGISTANTNVQVTWSVTSSGSSAYRFTGPGNDASDDNPDLYLIRGQRYRFTNNSGGAHPFQIRSSPGGSAYSTGVTNNGAASGNIDFNVQHDAPERLYYQCTNHGGMVGNIYIVGGSDWRMTDVNTSTAPEIYTTRNVGIGTDNPGGNLQVGSSGASHVIITQNTGIDINDGAINLYQATTNTNAVPFLISSDVGGTETEKLRVTAGGRVGIGTNNPSEKLHLYTDSSAEIKVESTSNSGIAGITLKANGGQVNFGEPGGVDTRGQIQYSNAANIINGAAADRMEFFTNNDISNAAITITSGNNIGIGTAVPAVSLDLASNTDALSLPTGTTAQRPTGTDAYIRKNSTNNALEFYNGTEWVEIITDYFPTGSTILG